MMPCTSCFWTRIQIDVNAGRLQAICMGLAVVQHLCRRHHLHFNVVSLHCAYAQRTRTFHHNSGVSRRIYCSKLVDAVANGSWGLRSIRSIVSRSVEAGLFSLISQIMTFVLFKVNTGFYFFWNDVVLTKASPGPICHLAPNSHCLRSTYSPSLSRLTHADPAVGYTTCPSVRGMATNPLLLGCSLRSRTSRYSHPARPQRACAHRMPRAHTLA